MLSATRRFLFLSGFLGEVSATSLLAQTFGEVTGHIRDASGVAVPTAAIVLTNTANNANRETVSAVSGDYTFAAVSNVRVQVQQTVRQEFTLEVGQATGSVAGSASALMLRTENLPLGTVVENKGVTELPLNGRNYLGLVALASNTNKLSANSGQSGGRQGGDRAASNRGR